MSASPVDPVVAAKARADAARARLRGTVGELRYRLSPQVLAQEAAETVKDKGRTLALSTADTVQRRPAVVAAVAGGIVLFFARRPLAALLRRATGRVPRSPVIPASKIGPAR